MCYHTNAYKEGCRDCMNDFKILHASEIKMANFEKVFKSYKVAGYFK